MVCVTCPLRLCQRSWLADGEKGSLPAFSVSSIRDTTVGRSTPESEMEKSMCQRSGEGAAHPPRSVWRLAPASADVRVSQRTRVSTWESAHRAVIGCQTGPGTLPPSSELEDGAPDLYHLETISRRRRFPRGDRSAGSVKPTSSQSSVFTSSSWTLSQVPHSDLFLVGDCQSRFLHHAAVRDVSVTNDSSEPGLVSHASIPPSSSTSRILALHQDFHKHLWCCPHWFPLPFLCPPVLPWLTG